MNCYHTLEVILRDILRVINPSGDDWSIRFRIIEELRAVILSVESLRGATVEPFGSFVSNLFTRWGDLDISIELPNGSYISAAGKKHKQTLLGEVLSAMRRKGEWRRLQFISHARVPILKFESSYQNISCDISINNLSGQMKSKLLFWLNEIDGRFREMVLLVKEWAIANGINNSKAGTMNSYSLSLLVIFHFQTCIPAILPPLREIYPRNMVDDLQGVRAVAEQQIEETCAVNINRFRSRRSQINHSSLAELFISFLAKFSDIHLKASEQGICPFTGQWEDIESTKTWLPKTFALYVEDPFEHPVNTARSVSSRQLGRISEAFQNTHQLLTSAFPNNSFPVAALVRGEVLSLLMTNTAQVCNPSIGGGPSAGTHPQYVGRISEFQSTQQLLTSAYPNNSFPMAALVRGEVSSLLMANSPKALNPSNVGGASAGTRPQYPRYPMNSVYGHSVHPQLNRNASNSSRNQGRSAPISGPAPGHVQPQFQRQMVEQRPNAVMTYRPGAASHGQVQQRWRPRSDK